MRNVPPILCLVLFAALAWPAAAAQSIQERGGSDKAVPVPAPRPAAKSPASKQPAKPAAKSPAVPPVAAPAKPRDVTPRDVKPPAVKPTGGSQGDGILQDPRAPAPTRPRISPPFGKSRGILALHGPRNADPLPATRLE